MANPNLFNTANIYGVTAVANVTTTPTDIVTNSAASGEVLKINSLIISNINGTAAADITASVYRSSVEYKIAHTVSVPADAVLIVVSKETSIYLNEGDSLRLTASANSYLQAVCSYDDIS